MYMQNRASLSIPASQRLCSPSSTVVVQETPASMSTVQKPLHQQNSKLGRQQRPLSKRKHKSCLVRQSSVSATDCYRYQYRTDW